MLKGHAERQNDAFKGDVERSGGEEEGETADSLLEGQDKKYRQPKDRTTCCRALVMAPTRVHRPPIANSYTW